MGYAYSCQEKAEGKRNGILYIPENTIIKEECLLGIDNETFVRCFRNLQEMARNVYDDMIINFAEYGIKAEKDKGGHFNLVSCFGDVLYQIALLGELDNNTLSVNIAKFKEGSKKHKFNKIINKLRDNGFEITNHSGKTFNKGAEYFEVSYPDMPEIINVLKGYSVIIAEHLENTKPTLRFYMTDMYNFITFPFRFVEDETTRKYPEPSFMTITDLYSDNGKKILYWLHDEADKYGYSCGMGFGGINFAKGSKEFMSLSENEHKKIGTKIIFRKVFETHKDKVAQVALDFPETFIPKYYICGARSPKCDTCKWAIKYEMNGINHSACAFMSFDFNDITLDNVGKIFELYLIENKIVANTR